MSSSQPLHGYLNDHLAGSAVALELIDKLSANNEDASFNSFLDELRGEIETDRSVLEEAMETLGVPRSTVKQAGGWMIEKASRIKFDQHLTGSRHLSRLMETEALSLGIEGKRVGWCTLKEFSDGNLDVDLDALMARATDQRARLEPFRIQAARQALAESQIGSASSCRAGS